MQIIHHDWNGKECLCVVECFKLLHSGETAVFYYFLTKKHDGRIVKYFGISFLLIDDKLSMALNGVCRLPEYNRNTGLNFIRNQFKVITETVHYGKDFLLSFCHISKL